jgi:O-antigen/teichoic acid export membrane protein
MTKKIIGSDYIIAILTRLFLIISGLINSICINRYLGPDLRGEYAYVINLVNIVNLIMTLGLVLGYPYFKKNNYKDAKQHFINIFYLQIMIYLVIIVSLFYNDELFYILIFSSIVSFNYQISFMAVIDEINQKNKITLVSNFSYSILLMFIYFSLKVDLRYIYMLFIFKYILELVMYILKYKYFPKIICFQFKFLFKTIKFGFIPMLISILILFNYNIDVIILKKYVSFYDIGIYSTGVTLAKMMWIIPDAFKEVLFNRTAKEDCLAEINKGIKFNLFFSFITILAIVIFGKDILSILYGNEYINSYFVTIILLLGSIPMIFFKLLNTLYTSNGKQKVVLFILILAVALNVILNFATIPHIGIMGAALSSVISYMICGILFLIVYIKDYKVKIKDILIIDKNDIRKVISNRR